MPISKYIKPFLRGLIEKGSDFVLSKTNPFIGNILIGANDISKKYGISDKYTSKAMDIALNKLSNTNKLIPDILNNLMDVGVDMVENKINKEINNGLGKLTEKLQATAYYRPELLPYANQGISNLGYDPATNNSYDKSNPYFDTPDTKEDIKLVKKIPVRKPKVIVEDKDYGKPIKDIYYNSKPQKPKIYKKVL